LNSDAGTGPFDPPEHLRPFGELLLPAGSTIHRIYRVVEGHTAVTFNPAEGEPTRFAPLRATGWHSERRVVPTLYAGASFSGAILETILRDLPLAPLRRVFPEQKLVGRAHARIVTRSAFRLAKLFNPNLGVNGLSRAQLIECAGLEAYLQTVKWAEAIYDNFHELHGLAWMSRQDDSCQAYMLFGDRVAEEDLVVQSTRPIDDGPGRADFAALVKEYKIGITQRKP
jgi:hypothetical protein